MQECNNVWPHKLKSYCSFFSLWWLWDRIEKSSRIDLIFLQKQSVARNCTIRWFEFPEQRTSALQPINSHVRIYFRFPWMKVTIVEAKFSYVSCMRNITTITMFHILLSGTWLKFRNGERSARRHSLIRTRAEYKSRIFFWETCLFLANYGPVFFQRAGFFL